MPFTVPPIVPEGAMRDSGQPTLTISDGVQARPMRDDDAEWIVEAFEDPAIQRWHSRDLTRDEALAWIRESATRWSKEEGGNWAVVDSNDRPLGRLGLHSVALSFGVAEVGYWVLPQARSRGVATAGVNRLSAWAFEDLGLHRLAIHHSVDNVPSCKVAEGAGYAFEGIMQSALKHADGWHDMHLHARISSD